MATATFPLARAGLSARYRIDEERTERSLQALRDGLARIESELQPSGYLVGDAFSVADLTAAALYSPLLRPPQFPYHLGEPPPSLAAAVASLEGPATDWIREMYARHRSPSAEVAAPR